MRGCPVSLNRLIFRMFWLKCKDERKRRNDRLGEGGSIFPYIKNIPSFLKKMVMFLRNITIFLENISIFFGNIKVFLQQESVSKLNRPIPSSAVGAGFACPKTQSKLFSGERTSPPYEPDDNIIHVLTTPSYTPSIMGIVYEDCYHYLLKLSPLLMKNLKRSKKLHQLFRKLHQLFQKLHQLF